MIQLSSPSFTVRARDRTPPGSPFTDPSRRPPTTTPLPPPPPPPRAGRPPPREPRPDPPPPGSAWAPPSSPHFPPPSPLPRPAGRGGPRTKASKKNPAHPPYPPPPQGPPGRPRRLPRGPPGTLSSVLLIGVARLWAWRGHNRRRRQERRGEGQRGIWCGIARLPAIRLMCSRVTQITVLSRRASRAPRAPFWQACRERTASEGTPCLGAALRDVRSRRRYSRT